MKKQYILMAIAALLVATAVIGNSLAAGQAETIEAQRTPLTMQGMAIQLQKSDGSELTQDNCITATGAILPGDTVDAQASVQSTEAVPCYVRVTITKYWTDLNTKEKFVDAGHDPNLIQLTTGENSGWLLNADQSTDERVVLYYTQPLTDANDKTSTPFLQSFSLPATLDNAYAGLGISLEVKADAVQYSRQSNDINADAIQSLWGVVPTIGADGVITGIRNP